MNKSLFKFLGVGLICVLGISLLPKYAVHNNSDTLVSEANESAEMGSDEAAHQLGHQQEFSDSDRKRIESLKKEYKNSQNPKEKVKFADSLFVLFRKYQILDSTAVYAEKRIPAQAEVNDWLLAGNAYYQVFSVAFSRQQAKIAGEKARTYFEKALEVVPDSLGVKARVAMTYSVSEQPMLSATKLLEIIKVAPEHQETLYYLGMLSVQSGQYSKGIARFKKLIGLNPVHLQGHFYLGVCYFEMGNKPLAKEQFERVKNLSADPVVQNEAEKYLKKI